MPITFTTHTPKVKSDKIILLLPGGFRLFGSVDERMKKNVVQPFVNQGYIVITVCYGEEDEYGGTDYDELLSKVQSLKGLTVGVYGISRGGMMAYMLMRDIPWIRCVATLGGLSDLRSNATLRPEMHKVYIKAFGATEEGYTQRSVVDWVHELHDIPLLLLHGNADTRVCYKDHTLFTNALRAKSHPVKSHVFEGGDHILSTHKKEKWELLFTWFKKYL